MRGHGYRKSSAWGFRGPECLSCGGTRAAVKESGYTDDGLRIRRRACLDCGASCASVEVFINPELTSFARLNGRRIRRDRESQYANRGKGLWRVPQRWSEPDQIRVSVDLRKPRRKETTLPEDLLSRVCTHPEHVNPTMSPEGWVVTGEEAWLPDEWADHSRAPLSEGERKEKDRARKREKYHSDPEYRRKHLERVRLSKLKRAA